MDILFGEFGRGGILYIKNYLIYNMDNLIGGYGGIRGVLIKIVHIPV